MRRLLAIALLLVLAVPGPRPGRHSRGRGRHQSDSGGAVRAAQPQRGHRAPQEGDNAGALKGAREFVKSQPGSAAGHEVHGVAAQVNRLSREAEAAYSESLRLEPGRVTVMLRLGQLALEAREAKKAEGWFRKAVAANPDLGAARRGLALSLLAQRQLRRRWRRSRRRSSARWPRRGRQVPPGSDHERCRAPLRRGAGAGRGTGRPARPPPRAAAAGAGEARAAQDRRGGSAVCPGRPARSQVHAGPLGARHRRARAGPARSRRHRHRGRHPGPARLGPGLSRARAHPAGPAPGRCGAQGVRPRRADEPGSRGDARPRRPEPRGGGRDRPRHRQGPGLPRVRQRGPARPHAARPALRREGPARPRRARAAGFDQRRTAGSHAAPQSRALLPGSAARRPTRWRRWSARPR